MRVRLFAPYKTMGEDKKIKECVIGEVVDLPEEEAQRLVDIKQAEKVGESVGKPITFDDMTLKDKKISELEETNQKISEQVKGLQKELKELKEVKAKKPKE